MQTDSDSNGARRPMREWDLYAMVIYLPDPLGSFLDQLRRDLAPGCNPHAHVSVLPPRLLTAGQHAMEQGRRTLGAVSPFEIHLGGIEVFPLTDVIYISVNDGAEQLCRMHEALNCDHFQSQELFTYHPHVTLAQELAADDVERLREQAARSWRQFPGPRSFRAEKAVFVKNIRDNEWIDLDTIRFGGVPVHP